LKKFLQKIPDIKLDYLEQLTDNTGIIQHSKFNTPNRKEGYATDDNARALIICSRYGQVNSEQEKRLLKLADIYFSFLYHMHLEDGRFHNFLGYNRRFLDSVGSDDCLGRVVWACGCVINSKFSKEKKFLVRELFDRALPHIYNSTSPRAKAFGILGLCEFKKAYPKNNDLADKIVLLCKELEMLYNQNFSKDWMWFENIITYCNGRLPQALFNASNVLVEEKYLKIAKESLNFLFKIQMNDSVFEPVGNKGWFRKNGVKARYDQQSIEAGCMVEALLSAWRTTMDMDYKAKSQEIFEWFLGRNNKKLWVYDQESGGCFDGLTSKGLNLNQGAEATISYLLARLNLNMSLS
jgi:hypothetical protein